MQNALQGKYCMRRVGQWERKIKCNLSKHELYQITSVNSIAIKLFKIGQNAIYIGEEILSDCVISRLLILYFTSYQSVHDWCVFTY